MGSDITIHNVQQPPLWRDEPHLSPGPPANAVVIVGDEQDIGHALKRLRKRIGEAGVLKFFHDRLYRRESPRRGEVKRLKHRRAMARLRRTERRARRSA